MERKLATVLFIDLTDSTGLLLTSDPEVVRRRVNRYFERAARSIESFGGTVEKFAGDAVFAAFGVPRAHEDDAERAIRAAFAVMESVQELGLTAHAGIESGEVVVEDTDSTFATGEAVTIAARLQQAAAPGEIVIGPGARRLAAGCVEVEDIGPLELRGFENPIWTWRAVGLLDGVGRRRNAPLVGREPELELLHNTFARTVRDRRAHLVTVYGDPGIGKSRLIEEFTEGVERATVLTGRALPYGEGVTYWPLASMVKASAGITDDDPAGEVFDKLRLCCESEAVADLLAVALGVLGGASGDRTSGELSWAALRWAAQLAEAQPLVLVFEDVHWAAEPLLELVEHVVRSLRDAPLLVVCAARPDLLELQPTWAGGVVRATSIELAPLSSTESEELVDALLGRDVPPAQRALALEKAEGNPLFLEETARMLGDGDAVRIPDNVQALIAARIDTLEATDRHVLQCAAIIGRVFWRGAVDRLCPEWDVAAAIDSLLEREFIVAEELSTISGDRAFRFKHGLIREVAYATTSKSQRADLHRVFADWVAERAPDELVEVRAYHLDRALCLLRELDGDADGELIRTAAAALEQAGRRSLAQEANKTARKLLLRAVEVEPTLARRYEAARAAQRVGDSAAVEREMTRVRDEARAAGDGRIEGRAICALANVELHRRGDASLVEELAREALSVLEDDDLDGRFQATSALYDSAWFRGRLGDAELHLQDALELAERANRPDLVFEVLCKLHWIAEMRMDRDHQDELLARLHKLASASESAYTLAAALSSEAATHRLRGEFDEAKRDYAESQRLYREIDASRNVAWIDVFLGWIAWIEDDQTAAERRFRDALRTLTQLGASSYVCEAQRALAELLLARGRLEEAERLAQSAKDTVSQHDISSLGTVTTTLALVRAAQRRDEEAETLLRQALAVYDGTDFRVLRFEPQTALAEFLLERGRDDEASELLVDLPDPVPGWLGRADARSVALLAQARSA